MPGNRDPLAGDDRRSFWEHIRHDLRQPVQSLQLLAHVFERHAGSGPVREGAEHMRRVVEDLVRMHDAVVRIAQLESGPAPERRALALSAVARNLEDLAAERNVDLRLAEPEVSLEADEAWLGLILRHLVLFALDHGEGAEVSVTAAKRADAVAITVAFPGPAIADRQAGKAFVESRAPDNDTPPGELVMGPGYLRYLCSLLGYRLERGPAAEDRQSFTLTVPQPAAS